MVHFIPGHRLRKQTRHRYYYIHMFVRTPQMKYLNDRETFCDTNGFNKYIIAALLLLQKYFIRRSLNLIAPKLFWQSSGTYNFAKLIRRLLLDKNMATDERQSGMHVQVHYQVYDQYNYLWVIIVAPLPYP